MTAEDKKLFDLLTLREKMGSTIKNLTLEANEMADLDLKPFYLELRRNSIEKKKAIDKAIADLVKEE